MEDIIKETIDVGITQETVSIPLLVKMSANKSEPNFEYSLSIDDIGQIVVTPSDKESEFISVELDQEYESRESFIDIVTCDEDADKCVKEFNMVLTSTMLAESENYSFSTIIDEIGQIVVQPNAKENTFVTVSDVKSLDLVTEDFQLTEYLGYTLKNTGDGWDIIDSDGAVINRGVETLPKAKLFICKLEINKLNEEIEPSEETTDEIPEVEVEVIEESVEPEWVEYAELCRLTDNFTEEQGSIECEDEEEQEQCELHLSEHYPCVSSRKVGNKFIVSYSKNLEEEFSELDIIDKVLKGDISIFEGEGAPKESYIHLSKLDSDDLTYYYDPESGEVVTYKGEN